MKFTKTILYVLLLLILINPVFAQQYDITQQNDGNFFSHFVVLLRDLVGLQPNQAESQQFNVTNGNIIDITPHDRGLHLGLKKRSDDILADVNIALYQYIGNQWREPNTQSTQIELVDGQIKFGGRFQNSNNKLLALEYDTDLPTSHLGDLVYIWTDIHNREYILINNSDLPCSGSCNYTTITTRSGENKSVVIFSASSEYDPTISIGADTLINQSYLEGANSNGAYIHLNIDNNIFPYDHLQAYYTGDVDTGGLVYDHSRYNHTATLNSVTYTNNCVYDDCLDFNANNNYISATGFSDLKGYNWTLSTWVKINKYDAAGATIMGTNNSDGASQIFVNIESDTSAFLTWPDKLIFSAIDFDDGNWRHLTFVCNETDGLFYVNGVFVDNTGSQCASMTNVSKKVEFGRWFLNPNTDLNGSMDDIMLFNISLNSSQIQEIYTNQSDRYVTEGLVVHPFITLNVSNNETGQNRANISYANYERNYNSNISTNISYWNESQGYTYPEDNLVAHYKFDADFEDSSGNNNNCTIISNGLENATGYFGGAMHFNGHLDQGVVYCGDLSSYFSTNNATVSWAWKSDTATPNIHDSVILDLSTTISLAHWSDNLGYQTNYLRGDRQNIAAGGFIDPTQWHVLTITTKGSGIANGYRIFVDGQYVTSYTSTTLQGLNNLTFGTQENPSNGGYFALGTLDEFVLLNTTLTDEEVKQAYINNWRNWSNNITLYNITDYNATHSLDTVNISNNGEYLRIISGMSSDGFYTPILTDQIDIELYTEGTTPPVADTTPPNVTNVQTNTSSIYTGDSINISAVVVDDTAVDTVIANVTKSDATYSTVILTGGSPYSGIYNTSFGYPLGQYNVTIIANDTLGNINNTEIISFLVNQSPLDQDFFLQLYNYSPSPSSGNEYSPSQDYYFLIDVLTSGTIEWVNLTLEGINYTLPDSGNGTYNFTAPQLGAGNYSLFFTAGLTNSSINMTQNFTYEVKKANVNLEIDFDPSSTINQGSDVNITGTGCPTQLTCTLYFNGSPVPNPYQYNDSALQNITVEYVTSGNDNYTADNESQTLTVLEVLPDETSPKYFTLTESPSDPATFDLPQTYSFQILWRSNGTLDTLGIEFNGINYTQSGSGNGTYTFNFYNLSAGNESYYFWANNTLGEYNQTSNLTYEVQKATPTLGLSISPSSTVSNGTQTTVTGTSCPSQLTCVLYRDGSIVSNPDIANLTIGSYQYTYNTSGNSNYTIASNTATLTIQNSTTTTTQDLGDVALQINLITILGFGLLLCIVGYYIGNPVLFLFSGVWFIINGFYSLSSLYGFPSGYYSTTFFFLLGIVLVYQGISDFVHNTNMNKRKQ